MADHPLSSSSSSSSAPEQDVAVAVAPKETPPSGKELEPEMAVAKVVDEYAKPWLIQTVAQAQELKRSVVESGDEAIRTARAHIGDLRSASSLHISAAQEFTNTAWAYYREYENLVFGKLKEGIVTASNHPTASYSAAAGLGLLLMKRPRRFLFRQTIGRFQSTESLLANSEKKVKDLRQSMDLLQNESKKLEERARLAEEELQRGQTKLKQTGSQLQSLVTSIYKTERQAKGLMDNLRELQGKEALNLRAEVATMNAAIRQQRSSLNKKISRILDHGIAV